MSVLPEMSDDQSERKYRQDAEGEETFLDACLRHAARLAAFSRIVRVVESAVLCADAKVLVEAQGAVGAASGCS